MKETKSKSDINCKGCRLLSNPINCDLQYTFSLKEHTYTCPCGVCLIKTMCSCYCEAYLTYVGQYFEFIKTNPAKYMDKYIEPIPPIKQYILRTYRGIPIVVKHDMWEDKLDVGPTIKTSKGIV